MDASLSFSSFVLCLSLNAIKINFWAYTFVAFSSKQMEVGKKREHLRKGEREGRIQGEIEREREKEREREGGRESKRAREDE